jgi:hypothetical protein
MAVESPLDVPLSARRRRLQSPQPGAHHSAPGAGAVGSVLKRTAAVHFNQVNEAVLGGELNSSTTPGLWPDSEGRE